jgi:hypothetical protein
MNTWNTRDVYKFIGHNHFDGSTQLAAETDSRKPVGFFTPVREA